MAWFASFLVAATAFLALKGTGVIHLVKSEEPDTLRIALAKWPPYDLLHLAGDLGYFEAEGVRVELVEFSTQGDCRRAFERGQVDVMSASSLELVTSSVFSKRTPRAFVVIDESLGGDAVVAARSLKSLGDLAGKRIGIERGTVNVLMLHETLKQANLSVKQVEIVNLTQAEMPDALATGKVDAVCTYYPYIEEAVKRGGHILFSSVAAPGAIIDMLVADSETLDARRVEFAGLTRAYLRVLEYKENDPTKTYRFIAERQKMDEESIREILTRHVRIVAADEQESWLTQGGIADRSTRSAIGALKATGYVDEVHQSEFVTPEIVRMTRQE